MLLKGEKIYIRSLIKSDANQIFINANDKDIAKFTTIQYPYKIEEAYKFIQQSQINIKKKKSFALGIFLKESNDFIGLVSLDEVDLNNMNAEIGFWMGKEYRKKGYMQKAIKVILNFGFKELKLERIYAKVFSINEGSINLLKKIGFKYEGTLRKSFLKDGVFIDDLIYSILREEHDNTK